MSTIRMPRLPASAQGSPVDYARRRESYERHGIRVYDATTGRMYTPATYAAEPPAPRPVLPMLTTPTRHAVLPMDRLNEEPVQVAATAKSGRTHRPARAVFRSSRRPRSAGAAHKRRPRRMVRVA